MCDMAREVDVCQECYRNCLVIHREKHDHSQKILTFFKIMFGKNISELLFVPPKFQRRFASLVGKRSYIEDSTGQKWKVYLSDVEGSLAFKKGWNKFYQGNGIKHGDFLVFHYVKDSQFIVTIYDRTGYEKPAHGRNGYEKPVRGRSGYEKLVPAEWSHQNKKLRTTSNSTTKKYSSDSLYDERESPPKSGYSNDFSVPRSDSDYILSQDDQSNVKKLLVVAENVPKTDVLMEPCILNDKETTFAKEDDLTNSLLVAENVPKTDSLMEPCFLNDKETTFAKEDDREHLDLSIFELPHIKPIIAKQGDDSHLSGLFTCKLTEKKVDANYIGELEVHGNTCSEVLGALHKFQPGDASLDLAEKTRPDMPSVELADVNSSYTQRGNENHLTDLSTFELTDKKVDANNIGELQIQGNPCSKVLGALPEDASIDLAEKTRLSEATTVPPSKKTEAKPSKFESIPVPSVSSKVSMPLNSVMPLKTIKEFVTFEPSSASGNAMRVVKQEPKEVGRGLFDTDVDDPPIGAPEDLTEDDAPVFRAVKTEPVDLCECNSAPTIRIKCSIPSDSESFLVLPEPLPLKRGHNLRMRQKMILLRNPAGEVWPLLYFNTFYKVLASGWKAFRKANNIRSGDECVFVLDSLDKGIFLVETSRS